MMVMDWYRRYVLSHEVSDTQEGSFCVVALEGALAGDSESIPAVPPDRHHPALISGLALCPNRRSNRANHPSRRVHVRS